MNFFSKTYTSIGGFSARTWYHFGICFSFEKSFKWIGYYDNYYDGSFHNFYIYPMRISWHKRPLRCDRLKKSKP